MDPVKIQELKQRAKSAFGFKQKRFDTKKKLKDKKESLKNEKNINLLNPKKDNINNNKNKNINRILSPKVKNTNYNSTNFTKPTSAFPSINGIKTRTNSDFYSYRNNDNVNLNYNLEENQLFNFNDYKNIININNKLINDLNAQINSLNEKKKSKRFNYKQTVNLQKLNDYIIYEYTKNKMEIGKENNRKSTTSFRLPIQYRRMGNHGKKEDLVPINNKPKINLEDILILHNSNLRNSMTKNKVENYYMKNNLKYKKFNFTPLYEDNNKYYPEEIALKYINIL